MKGYTTIKTIAAVALVATAVAGIMVVQASAQDDHPSRHRGMFQDRLADLGLTDDQKAKAKEILRQHQPTVQPLVRQSVAERRALRKVIRAEPIDETAIRAQSAKVASVEADLAVARAYVVKDLRAVLTDDQIAKLKDMQTEFYERVDRMMEHAGKRIAE
jgi:Spy/CpxP family protein refolding chaperone